MYVVQRMDCDTLCSSVFCWPTATPYSWHSHVVTVLQRLRVRHLTHSWKAWTSVIRQKFQKEQYRRVEPVSVVRLRSLLLRIVRRIGSLLDLEQRRHRPWFVFI